MRSARRWKRSSSPPGTAWKRNALPRSSARSRGTSGRLRNTPDCGRRLGLVGKGVTVDTGGYCLKPASSMAGIKGDMAGGAAAAAALRALAANGVPVNVTVVVPVCENRISDSDRKSVV